MQGCRCLWTGSVSWGVRHGGARTVDVHEFAIEAELVQVAAWSLDPYSRIEAARLDRVEAGRADQALGGRAGFGRTGRRCPCLKAVSVRNRVFDHLSPALVNRLGPEFVRGAEVLDDSADTDIVVCVGCCAHFVHKPYIT